MCKRFQGKVLQYDREKGWGFIRCQGLDDMFVHHTQIAGLRDDLLEGETVQFSIGFHEDRPCALNVVTISRRDATTRTYRCPECDHVMKLTEIEIGHSLDKAVPASKEWNGGENADL